MFRLPSALRIRAIATAAASMSNSASHSSSLFTTTSIPSTFIPPPSPVLQHRHRLRHQIRLISTLPNNPHIYIHSSSSSSSPNSSQQQTQQSYILTLLPTDPPTPSLSLGTTTSLPITPQTFTPNPSFLPHLHATLRHHAASDPTILAAAAAYASSAGSVFGSTIGGAEGSGASGQGGAGGGGRGGWVHVSDTRNVPEFGRIAWPEDIIGSVEVDDAGRVLVEEEEDDDAGEKGAVYQESGTYRVVTREGILGLSDYIREKLVERLLKEEKKLKESGKP